MKAKRIIIVDDDACNNMLCRYMIEKTMDAQILEFINPEEAVDFITTSYEKASLTVPTILLLDINMPEMTGWQFLQWFHSTPPYVKESITIYMVSSSVDDRDQMKAHQNPYIKEFFVKPLEIENIIRSIAQCCVTD